MPLQNRITSRMARSRPIRHAVISWGIVASSTMQTGSWADAVGRTTTGLFITPRSADAIARVAIATRSADEAVAAGHRPFYE